MYPELFSVGPFTLYTFTVTLLGGYLIGLWLALRRARRMGLKREQVLDLGIFIIVAAMLGAKLLYLIVNLPQYWNDPRQLVDALRAAGAFYGGLILALVVAFWYIHRHGMPLWAVCDVFTPGIALGHAIGRFGCLAAGCCYGRPTDVPWAIVFTNPAAAANAGTPLGIPLHPTQLYEAGTELLILVMLVTTERRGRPFPGRTFWAYMFLYAVSRYVIEIYRNDPRGVVPGLDISTSQLISLILAPLSLAMLFWLQRTTPDTPSRLRQRKRVAA